MTLCGIFVGGGATRMGGRPKGLLPSPESGEPLVVRLARLARELGCEPVLVGDSAPYRAALPELRVIADAPAGIGPLGGLGGLLGALGDDAQHEPHALALACDLPHVSRRLLARLVHAPEQAAVLAARSALGHWEPLCARYHGPSVRAELPAALRAGVRSFQALLGRLPVAELTLTEAERGELVDWDTPEDVALGQQR